MHYSSILITIAEISGVFIGFANLASAFEKSNENVVIRQTNKIRLLIITEGGMINIFACLIPFLLSAFNYTEVMAFRISSYILIPGGVFNAVYNFKRGVKLTGIPLLEQMTGLPNQTRIGSVMIVMNILFIAPLILIATGYFDDGSIAGLYCLSILGIFLILCIFLVRFIRQIIS